MTLFLFIDARRKMTIENYNNILMWVKIICYVKSRDKRCHGILVGTEPSRMIFRVTTWLSMVPQERDFLMRSKINITQLLILPEIWISSLITLAGWKLLQISSKKFTLIWLNVLLQYSLTKFIFFDEFPYYTLRYIAWCVI